MIVSAVLTTDELQWIGYWNGYMVRRWQPATMRLERARSGNMPVLIDHWNGARVRVGSVIGDTVEVTGGELRADLWLVETLLGEDLTSALEAGMLPNLSVGVLPWSVTSYETDGNEMYDVTDSEPVEVSLVGAGACAGARVLEQ